MICIDNNYRHALAALSISMARAGIDILVVDESEGTGVKITPSSSFPPTEICCINASMPCVPKLPFIGKTRGPKPLPFDMTLKRRKQRR